MAADVTVGEVARLARAMTLKNAAAGWLMVAARQASSRTPICPPTRRSCWYGGSPAPSTTSPTTSPAPTWAPTRFAWRGAVGDPDGLELEKLEAWKADGNSIGSFPDAAPLEIEDLVAVDCDIWIPAARPDVLNAASAGRVCASIVLEGANIPTTAEAEAALHSRGVLVVPDIIANAGGVICAAAEHQGGTKSQAFALIDERIRANSGAVLELADSSGTTPRVAAQRLARQRLAEAAHYRRRT